jgi:hypothetical protein
MRFIYIKILFKAHKYNEAFNLAVGSNNDGDRRLVLQPSTEQNSFIFCAVGPVRMSESAPAWETSKENVLPIKRGRSAKGLNDALSKSSIHQEVELASREREFESQLLACDPSQPPLMLEVYVQYMKWAKDAFPTSPNKFHKLLEVWPTIP